MEFQLSRGQKLTLSAALKKEPYVLQHIRRRNRAAEFELSLWNQRSAIEATVAQQLRVSTTQCTVEDKACWPRGQFNVIVLVQVKEGDTSSRKVVRCPMPHKVGHAADLDEKIRTEAANYAWIAAHCPEVPAAKLLAFGLSDRQFAHESFLPWYHRLFRSVHRLVRSIWGQPLYQYAHTGMPSSIGPYMILHFIERSQGRMLSCTWKLLKHDQGCRKNLFTGLARILLSLGRIPQPRIGSLRYNDDGSISLSNRPWLCSLTLLEAEGAPCTVKTPYQRTDMFLNDMVNFRKDHFLWQPNAASDEADAELVMSHIALLQGLLPRMVDYYYEGPFVLQNTDLHASNIFVDEDWNVTAIIDLDYICALPPEMIDVPYWFTADFIDDIDVKTHTVIHDEFLKELERQGQGIQTCIALGPWIDQAWHSGAHFCYKALTSINGLPAMMEDFIWPLYDFKPTLIEQETFNRMHSHFYSKDSRNVTVSKIADKERYSQDLRALYQTAEM